MTNREIQKQISTILHGLDKNFEKPFIILGLLAIIVIIVFQTFYRYIGIPLGANSEGAVWSEELARFIFIWLTYLALPISIRTRSSIRVDILHERLPPRLKSVNWMVVELLFLSLTAAVFIVSFRYLKYQLRFPQKTAVMRIPYLVPYMIVPIGFFLMSLRLVQNLISESRKTGVKLTLLGALIVLLLSLPVFLIPSLNPSAMLFSSFILFLALGLPVMICLGLSAVITIVNSGTLPLQFVAQTSFASIDSFPIMAIPFFIAAGIFMGGGGLSKRLLNLADQLFGSLHGGLALAAIGTSMFFAAISGSGPATVAAIGVLTIPAMIKGGYDKHFACAVVACAGAIGVMIPPSNPFVVYGITAQVSIGKLFIAGAVPGILTGIGLMAVTYIISRRNGWRGGSSRKRTLKSVLQSLWDAKLALLVPVIVLGGIYGGVMTPTEAAAAAALYGLLIGVFVYKEFTLKSVLNSFVESGLTSAVVIGLIAMAAVFGQILTIENIPESAAQFILGLTTNRFLLLLMVNILLLFIGTFMEALAAIVILVPILLPVMTELGMNPMHFGVLMVVNLAIGFVTPPVGVNLFVAGSITNQKIEKISKSALPFIAVMVLILIVITYFPGLTEWVNSMNGP